MEGKKKHSPMLNIVYWMKKSLTEGNNFVLRKYGMRIFCRCVVIYKKRM